MVRRCGVCHEPAQGTLGRRRRQNKIKKNPKTIPPKCAKWAMLANVWVTPNKSSTTPNRMTAHFAFIGIGGMRRRIIRLGNNMPKARRMPKTPPDAPTVNVIEFSIMPAPSWKMAAPITQIR